MIIIIIMDLCFCTKHSYCITIIIVEMEDLEMEISWTLKVICYEVRSIRSFIWSIIEIVNYWNVEYTIASQYQRWLFHLIYHLICNVQVAEIWWIRNKSSTLFSVGIQLRFNRSQWMNDLRKDYLISRG